MRARFSHAKDNQNLISAFRGKREEQYVDEEKGEPNTNQLSSSATSRLRSHYSRVLNRDSLGKQRISLLCVAWVYRNIAKIIKYVKFNGKSHYLSENKDLAKRCACIGLLFDYYERISRKQGNVISNGKTPYGKTRLFRFECVPV